MNRLFNLEFNSDIVSINYNYHPGHKFGQGQISPCRNYNFIHIPKNASSQAKKIFKDWQWSNYYNLDSSTKHIIILRDPTSRWISGIAEFLIGKNSSLGSLNSDASINDINFLLNTKMFQNLLFDFVIFDEHTLPQSCYINGVKLSDAVFFYYDSQVFEKIAKFANIDYEPTWENQSLTNPKKQAIVNKLKKLLSDNTVLRQKIDKNYFADHQLLDRVKFYQ